MLRQEIAISSSFAHAFSRVLANHNQPSCHCEARADRAGIENKSSIKKDIARVSCICGSFNIEFFSVTNGDQKYMSVECQHCGKVWLTVPV